MNTKLSRVLGLVLVLSALLLGQPRIVRAGGDFRVNSSSDNNVRDDVLTLREAIMVANGSLTTGFTDLEALQLFGCIFDGSPSNTIIGGCGPGYYDTISFAPSITQITLTDSLPYLSDAGTWINGNAGVPRIDGSLLASGPAFYIEGSHITVSNVSIVNFPSTNPDIYVQWSVVDARIAYNYLGTVPGATDCSSSGITRNGSNGVFVETSVGTGGPGANNGAAYIYGNTIGCHSQDGIFVYEVDYVYIGVQPDGTTADGNWIGLNANGTLPNGGNGVRALAQHLGIGPHHATISNNVISGNGNSGILLQGASYTTIRNNKIGTNTAGSAAIPNAYDGIRLTDADSHHNVIGDNTTGGRNTISGNGQSGVHIINAAHDNTVDNNLIGRNSAGTALPNGTAGVAIESNANNNMIGAAGGGQEIANNAREGVYIANSTGTRIDLSNWIYNNGLAGVVVVGNGATGNAIVPGRVYNNGGLPIDLGGDGPTPNGSRTPPGPNNWINYPVVTWTSGSLVGGTTCAYCQVDIYRAVGNPAAAHGGGTFLGYVNANAGGAWSIDLSTLSGGAGLTRSDITLLTWDPTSGSSEMSPRPVLYLPLILKSP